MTAIDVRGIHDGTFTFTVTEQDHAPWGRGNTTIFVPSDHLAPLIHKLQARLQDVERPRTAQPMVAVGARVRVVGRLRHGQDGVVIAVQEKGERLQQRSGERWSYTVAFGDGNTWTYDGTDLEQVQVRVAGA